MNKKELEQAIQRIQANNNTVVKSNNKKIEIHTDNGKGVVHTLEQLGMQWEQALAFYKAFSLFQNQTGKYIFQVYL